MPSHLFDDLVKSIALHTTSRRLFTGGSLAILLGTGRVAARKKKRKGGKGKGNGKKPNHKRPSHLGQPIPGHDDCDDFVIHPEVQEDCKKIRETCEAPEHFCIFVVDHPGDEHNVGVACCPSHKECCLFGCTDTKREMRHCGGCDQLDCREDQVCRDGKCTCRATCPRPDQVCRDGKCTCPATCPKGTACRNGEGLACGPDDTDCRCWCGPNFQYCPNLNGGACASPNAVC